VIHLLLPLTLLAAEPAAAGGDPAPPIVAVAFAQDGTGVVAASQAGVLIYSWPDLRPAARLTTKLEQVHDLSFAPDGKRLAIAGGSPGERGAVEIWEWPAATLKATLPAGDDVVYGAAWNAEGTVLALACADKVVRLQPVDGSSPKKCQVHSAAALSTAWLPAEDLVLSAGVDQSIRLLSPKSGEVVRTFDNHTAAVRDLAADDPPAGAVCPPALGADGDFLDARWLACLGRVRRRPAAGG